MIRFSFLLLSIAFWSAPLAVCADELAIEASLKPGTMVRIKTSAGEQWLVGRFVSLDADSLWIRRQGWNAPHTVSVTDIRAFDYSREGGPDGKGGNVGKFLCGFGGGVIPALATATVSEGAALAGFVLGTTTAVYYAGKQHDEIGSYLGTLVGCALGTAVFEMALQSYDFNLIQALPFLCLPALGATLGFSFTRKHWCPVPVDRIRIGVLPRRNGAYRLSASLAF